MRTVLHRNWQGRVLDLVTYAIAGTALAVVVVGVVSFAAGFGLKGIKWGLFYLGWLMFGYSAILVFPASLHENQSLPGEDAKKSTGVGLLSGGMSGGEAESMDSSESEKTFASTDETKFQAIVQELPPARFARVRKGERFPAGLKLMALSFAVLGTSLAMELVLHVG
ncbi:MAG TPA: hypothetical protein VJ898_12905 [Natrialbaceae archaeon]|nr:hypothetical protein [Natrialbaceae archaeon]